ncbi:MAG TPA: glycosyltransferase [Opitutaceae bacterium]
MKLLHITNFYPPYAVGQAERQCRLVVNELAARGHFNRVLTSTYSLPNIPDRERFVGRVLRLGLRTTPGSYSPLIWAERLNRRALLDELEEVYSDVVVFWGMAGLSNSLIWEAQRSGVCVVLAVLDHWPRMRLREDPWMQWWTGSLALPQRILRRMMRALLVDRLVLAQYPVRAMTDLPTDTAFYASRALRDSIRSSGFSVGDSPIIPYCVGRDEIPGQPQRRDELRRLLWIGHLDTDRDPMTAIQAIQELRHSGQLQFTLDIFGRGEVAFEGRLHDYVRDAQLGGAVTVRHASVEEMVSLFPTYDIFLFSARYPEPFPMGILRAMAARLPVVSTLEGSCADLLSPGENCAAFRTGDPVECASKIRALAANRGLVDRIAENAYRDVLDNYSAVIVAGRIEKLLLDVVRAKSR